MPRRLPKTSGARGAFPVGFDLQLRPHKLVEPRRLKERSRVFVNSMSDLFHKDIPDEYLRQVWDVMMEVDRHVYQILTKRPQLMVEKIHQLGLPTPEHIWLGTSVEDQKRADLRLPHLLATGAPMKFLSCEPLLGPVDLTPWLHDLQWVIDGGESGPGRRPADYDWFRQIRNDCLTVGVDYYHKQGNGYKSEMDKELDGQLWRAIPDFPELAPVGQQSLF